MGRACADEVLGIKSFTQTYDAVSLRQVGGPGFTAQRVNLSLDQISRHRFSRPALGHDCANAAVRCLVLLVQGKMRSHRDYARGHDRIKVCALCQFVHVARQVARKPECNSLNRQAFAAFGSAGIDNCASSACFHTHQKAMGASASGFRGLVGTFHLI